LRATIFFVRMGAKVDVVGLVVSLTLAFFIVLTGLALSSRVLFRDNR